MYAYCPASGFRAWAASAAYLMSRNPCRYKACGASYDDEPGHDVGENAAHDHIPARGLKPTPGYPLFHNRGLQIELHPGRDGRPDHANHHVQVGLLPKLGPLGRLEGCFRSDFPCRMRQRSRENVSDIEERRCQENFLNALVLTFHHDQPNDHGTHRHSDVPRQAEQFEAGGDANKFRYHVAEVGDQNSEHHQKRDAQAELFADQIAQALAGHRAHAGGHLLHHDQRECDRDHGPEQKKSVLRAGLGIGEDAAGIVVDVGGDDPRSDYSQEQQGPASQSFQKSHASISQT